MSRNVLMRSTVVVFMRASYTLAHTFAMPYRIIRLCIVDAMEPRDLLRKLMTRDGLNPNSLAKRTNGRTKQPQIFRFLSGEAKEPKRSTLEPVAEVFGIEVDALFDRRVAAQVAKRLFPNEDQEATQTLFVVESPTAHSNGPSTIDKLMAATGLNIEVLLQLLQDLGDIPSDQLSPMLDAIHQQAELSRAAAAHFAKRGKIPEIAAKKVGGTSSKTIKIYRGDGNSNQGHLPLTTVDDPFSSEPGEREAAWYGRLETTKKPHGI